MSPILAVLVNLLLAHCTLAVPVVKESRQTVTPSCTEERLTAALPAGAGASVERFGHVDDRGSFGESNITNPAYGIATGLPPLCAAIIKVTTGDSSYRFGIFLPDTLKGNLSFIGVGNYAQAGGINWGDMAPAVHYGMATISTDTGHISKADVLSWARDRRGALDDWGYRAVNGSIHIGKALTKAYYPKNTTFGKSYWNGCSTGGRQGLKQIQISPDSLDGVLIGAPAWDTKHLFPWIAKSATYNLTGSLLPDQVGVIATTVMSQCDSPDKTTDFIISDPENCKPDFTKVNCTGTPNPTCLTQAQIDTANKIYSNYTLPTSGEFVQDRLYPGSEVQWFTFMATNSITTFDLEYFKHWLYPNDTTPGRWDNYTYFLDHQKEIITDSVNLDPGSATADDFASLNAFKNRGGKILLYHGTADGTVPTRSSHRFYEETRNALTNKTGMNDFLRFFPMPGMAHCWPNFVAYDNMNAPWMIAGAGQNALSSGTNYSVRGHLEEPDYDALAALRGWVVNGTAPEKIIASALNYWTGDAVRERPVCPWPKRAVFKGEVVDVDKAGGWICESESS